MIKLLASYGWFLIEDDQAGFSLGGDEYILHSYFLQTQSGQGDTGGSWTSSTQAPGHGRRTSLGRCFQAMI
jgi:hypothetical protein